MNQMNRKTIARCLSVALLGGACLAFPTLAADEKPAVADKPAAQAAVTTIKGTCTFNGKLSTWSAKLTPKGDGTYDAVYDSIWGGKPLSYTGTIKTDLKTEISGTGKGAGGRSNGNFEFSGKYGADGIAQCTYKEIGGKRTGPMTAEMPK